MSWKAGRTLYSATRSLFQILPPLPATTEPLSRKQARTSRGQREVTPPATSNQRKAEALLKFWPWTVSAPERRRRRQTLGPEAARLSAQAVSHQENSWEQKFASCSGLLGFGILPAGRARAGAALLWRRSCSWRRLRGGWEAQSHRGPLGRQNHRLWEWSTGVSAAALTSLWPPSPRLCSWGLERWGPRTKGGQADPVRGHTQV